MPVDYTDLSDVVNNVPPELLPVISHRKVRLDVGQQVTAYSVPQELADVRTKQWAGYAILDHNAGGERPAGSDMTTNVSNNNATLTLLPSTGVWVTPIMWSFGDGNVETTQGQIAIHFYEENGDYTVTATDKEGKIIVQELRVTIQQ